MPPTIPPRVLLGIRIAQFTFGIISIALSAASVQLIRSVPRPANSPDNILILAANAIGLITTLYRIIAYRARDPNGRHRLIPYMTESLVIGVLLAAFIVGAVYTSGGRGACSYGGDEEDDGGDGDDSEGGRSGGSACSLTKAATSFSAANFISFVASFYTILKGGYDEATS